MIKRIIHYNYFATLLLILAFVYQSISGQGKKPVFQSLPPDAFNQSIQCILKDSKGFLWFGTKDGLNKFDGTDFVLYENTPGDTTTISHNSINAIIEDEFHNIWIGASDGLNLYNRDKDNFTRIKFPSVQRIYISSLAAENNNLWIGTFGIGVVQFNYKTQYYKYNRNRTATPGTISSNIVTSITIDKFRNIWVGTRNGLNLLNPKTNTFKQIIHSNHAGSLGNNLVSSLCIDSRENLWVGTLGGGLNKLPLYKPDTIFQNFKHTANPKSLSNDIVLSICEDNSGNLWIGTENGGLNYFNTGLGTFDKFTTEEGNPGSINSNSIPTLHFDGNILWIGTYNQGINFIDNKFEKFERFQKGILSQNTIQDNDVTGFAEDPAGNIWIATDGGGICFFNANAKTVTNIISEQQDGQLANNNVQGIIYDKHDNIWVATWAGGIDRLNKSGRKIKNYKVEGALKAGDNKIITLYLDKQGGIWAGTAGSGVFLYNPATDKFIQVTDPEEKLKIYEIEFVTAVFEDSQNNIWIGTLYGLVQMKPLGNKKFTFTKHFDYHNPKTINSNRITVIFEDSRKNLWFGTEDMGLNCFNKNLNTYRYFQKQDGLPGNSIRGILEDKKGNLWISTNKGLAKYIAKSQKFETYNKNDGLNSDEFYRNSCIATKSGEFFFGGNKGFNVFQPDNITLNSFIPPVYITNFKVFNKSLPVGTDASPLKSHISQTKALTLTHTQNSFTIHYVALNYTRSAQNQYRYILEGMDKEWNLAGHNCLATYTNIHPGRYIFKVMGSNNDGVWNPTPTVLEITILPPFWRTIWAYIIYFLVFAGILYAFVRLILIRAKQAQVLALNQMKLNFFTNISHELRTPLTLILSPLENLVASTKVNSEIKGHLSLIYKNANRLFRLVNELMDFSKTEENELKIVAQPGDIVKFIRENYEFYSEEALRRKIDYRFLNSQPSLEAWFDRDKLEKIILNLLSNAFKFTPHEGKITVNLDTTTVGSVAFAKISVTDNGIGISQKYINKVFDRFFQSPEDNGLVQRGTGIGLALAKNLIELHHGNISVTSEQFKETCFTILLQLGSAHFGKEEIRPDPIDISTPTAYLETEDNAQTPPQNAFTVLLVEDNYELRKYIVSQLSGKYKMLEAENGEEGYDLAHKEIPDLIVSDVMMPKVSGIELCKKIKEDLTTSHIPVILLTAKTTLEEKIEGIQTGADVYITKPFNIRFLDVSIKTLINTRQKLYQRFSQEVFIMPKEFGNTPLDQDFLERTIDFIEKNIEKENLTVEELSSHLSLSHSQTYRKIKALTDQSVTEFIRTIRLKLAIKLMEAGKLSISEISFKVGFTSPAYFTKCFREQFGKPPSEYLTNAKKKM